MKWFNHEKNNYCTNKKEQVNLNWWNEKGNRETKNNINKSSKKSISKYDLKKNRMEKKKITYDRTWLICWGFIIDIKNLWSIQLLSL